MSEIKVNTLQTNNIFSNVLSVGASSTINSTGIFLNNSNASVNASAIKVSTGASNIIVQGVTSVAAVNIGGVSTTTLNVEAANSQFFTANGTWTKPTWATTGNELVIVQLWGAGGGGNTTSGGGGGAYVFGYLKSSQLDATETITVGIGGGAGLVGQSTTVNLASGKTLIARGGGQANTTRGGGGGGWQGAGSAQNGGAPLGNTTAGGLSTFGGGAGGNNTTANTGGTSVYGGGGGAFGTGAGGNTIFGGGGGASTGTRGTSIYGGFGGNSTVSATAPGGGAGPNASGANGEVRIYTLRMVN
jgi:hypothetical protein